MRVFISWSGELSRKLGKILYEWLPTIITPVEPFFSPDTIEKGTTWAQELTKELEETSFGILCLTRESLEAPWLLFEAGALSKKLEVARVCPLLFGVTPSDMKGPIAQFSATEFGKQEVKKLVSAINLQLETAALKSEVLDRVFERGWAELQESVEDAMSKTRGLGGGNERPDRELLEDILDLSRSLVRAQSASSVSGFEALKRLADSWEDHLEEIAGAGALAELYRTSSEMRRSIDDLVAAVEPVTDRKMLRAQLENTNEELDRIDPKIKFRHTGEIDLHGAE